MGWQIAYSRLPHDFSGLPFKMKKLTQLIKITPQVSGGGLRLQLHNHFGDEPLVFDRLEVSDNEKMQGAKMITRGGQTRIVIASHGTAQTDTLPFQVTAGQPLYFRMCATCNQSYVDFSCVYDETFYNAIITRSATATPQLPHNWQARKGWFCLSHLEVWTDQKLPLIELTGDSLAETGMLETGLIKHLQGQAVVVNTGISGNRLLHDAPKDGPLYHPAGEQSPSQGRDGEEIRSHRPAALCGHPPAWYRGLDRRPGGRPAGYAAEKLRALHFPGGVHRRHHHDLDHLRRDQRDMKKTQGNQNGIKKNFPLALPAESFFKPGKLYIAMRGKLK